MKKITFTEIEESQIIDLYINKLKTLDEISRKFSVSRYVIVNLLKQLNIKIRLPVHLKRIYNVNEGFFNVMGKEQSYFLGWIASDGSVQANNEVIFRLQDRDLDVIEKLKLLTNYDGPIKLERIKGTMRGKILAKRNMYHMSIADKKFANKLRELGYNNHKSYNLEFPEFLDKNLIPHFLRSFIEGDGSIIYVKGGNNLYVSFCSTNKFCQQFKSFIKKELDINVFIEPIKRDIDGNKNISKTHSRAVINGNCNSLKFLNYIYSGAFLYMNRKYKYFKNVVKILLKGNPKNKTMKQLLIAKNIIENS